MSADNVARLHELARQREELRGPLSEALRRLADCDEPLLQAWEAATLELVDVNAGPACIVAFWRATDPAFLHSAAAGGRAAASICRHAGARAALAFLETLPIALQLTNTDSAALAAWWQGVDRLAREAPSVVAGTVRRIETVLAGGDGLGFVDFVAAGLKATAKDKTRRAAFFALEDPLAQAWLRRRAAGGQGFAETERMVSAFVAGLWGGAPRLTVGPADVTRRVIIASGTVVMPPVYAGVPAEQARPLYRAAAAHAQAHLTVPAARQAIGSLKPLQVAFVGLIEDARVEALAIDAAPGLRQLWAGFHLAQPTGIISAMGLMARLARALLDPDYCDDDGFVEKGRALFGAADWADPRMSRSIGGLLGHDMGQMRLPFDARTYAVEPVYRDDNMHLWELPEAPEEALRLNVDAAPPQDGEAPGTDGAGEGRSAPRARDAGQDDRGDVLATYPEWDSVAGVERPAWTTLRDTLPVSRSPAALAQDEARLRGQIARLVRSTVVGLPQRQPRREDGETLDLDAVIDLTVARRAGLVHDGRIYRDRQPSGRDLATLIILDASQSTAAIDAAGQSVLAAQVAAVGALAHALDARGDRYAVRAFASAGREDVRLTRIKDFDERLSDAVMARLSGLTSGLSTRLGAALRHSGAELGPLRTSRKMLLVLTDGEPSDIDVSESDELVEDARRAARTLRQQGVDVFGIVMDPLGVGSAATIFGRHNTMFVRRLAELPARLASVYFRLSQR